MQDHPVRRYGHETPEFARVANLSDAVFAIAMTLLVLTLDVQEVAAEALARALSDVLPQLIAFLLAFALVASVWWAHHKLFAMLGVVEPGLIALNLVLLGTVALVPFPTGLLGSNPTARAAVLPFIGLFVVTLLVWLLLTVRANAVAAWRIPPPPELVPWLVRGWIANLGMMSTAFMVALWIPVAGLVIAAVSGTAVGIIMSLLAPQGYRRWA